MKKLNALVVAFALLIGTSLSAAALPAVNDDNPTTEEFGKLLENPDFKLDQEMYAQVSFILNEKNEVVVLSVETANQELEAFVKRRLNYHKLEVELKQGVSYKLPVRVTM
ncbi:MAG: hypothetical protein MK211_12460 [Flavobacteriales bacterium]|jgi:hypothetical protein|uniref:hypothetical protein n=1 Tax=Candidatus Ulvibacter alkanivorans TaxID=2267620 RepID=UPI000DF20BA9|nr:hypothetical protein [Candidatus Ulvibacter alkanivorans]MCH2490954.1 hypothetical protein [Flavobacteriales bacterium]|tara:strand:- start:152 stop:481 length:330 start_codon:yes stop_codon:yes gene_type:complete